MYLEVNEKEGHSITVTFFMAIFVHSKISLLLANKIAIKIGFAMKLFSFSKHLVSKQMRNF